MEYCSRPAEQYSAETSQLVTGHTTQVLRDTNMHAGNGSHTENAAATKH